MNKSKNFKKIQSDYDRDLDWIANLRNIPSAIAEYARYLAKEAKSSKAQLKANLAKRATKKRKTTNKGIIIKGPIYGGTVNATVNNAVSNAEGSGSRPEPVMNNERDVDEIPASIGKEWLRFIENHFIEGQAVLTGMGGQLRESCGVVDEKSQYKSDGLLKLYEYKDLEILLLETSGLFNNTDKVEVNFDHHKGFYGILAMLKILPMSILLPLLTHSVR